MPTAMTSCASLDKAPKDMPPVTKRLQMDTASSWEGNDWLSGKGFLEWFEGPKSEQNVKAEQCTSILA